MLLNEPLNTVRWGGREAASDLEDFGSSMSGERSSNLVFSWEPPAELSP
jgi:hypothetical protein